MMKISVTSVLLVAALLQLMMYCTALEHIHLNLNGNIDEIDERFKTIKDKVTKVDINSIKKYKEGHFRLYITGDFYICGDALVWDEGDRGAKEIAKIVSQKFGNEAIVIVVFPMITQLYDGFKFLETFEKEIQNTHESIAIGRGIIHFYFLLDEESTKIPVSISSIDGDDKLISIAANKLFNFYYFGREKWSEGVDRVSRILIQEADTVEIRLVAKCAEDSNELTVGGLKPNSLADEILKVVKAEAELTHPYQTIKVRLPKDCSKDVKKRSTFTETLIGTLKGKGLDVHGLEPSAVIQFASKEPSEDNFPGHAWRKITADYNENSNIQQYHAEYDNKNIIMKNFDEETITDVNTALSDIKELSIQVHCHGTFVKSSNSVCELKEKTLADKFKSIIPKKISNIQIIFYACNVGTKKGQVFVLEFLKNLEIKIQEVISFQSWTAQEGSTPAILVAIKDKYKATTIIDKQKTHKDAEPLIINLNENFYGKLDGRVENYAFGRFMTKIKIIRNKYKSFPVLPKTEFELDHDDKE